MKIFGMSVRGMMPPLVVGAILLAAWAALAALQLWPKHLFPSPLRAFEALVGLVQDGSLARGIATTLRRLAMGFGISLAMGAVLAVLLVRWPAARAGMQPYMLGVQSLPGIAWVPLAILWLGYSESALLLVTVLGSVFSVTIAFSDAISGVPALYYRAALTMGVGPTKLIARVGIPAALPQLIAGIRQGWSFAWRSLVGAEIVFAAVGLGFLLNRGREFLDTAEVFAVMATILALGVIFERIVFMRIEAAVRRRYGMSGAMGR